MLLIGKITKKLCQVSTAPAAVADGMKAATMASGRFLQRRTSGNSDAGTRSTFGDRISASE